MEDLKRNEGFLESVEAQKLSENKSSIWTVSLKGNNVFLFQTELIENFETHFEVEQEVKVQNSKEISN